MIFQTPVVGNCGGYFIFKTQKIHFIKKYIHQNLTVRNDSC